MTIDSARNIDELRAQERERAAIPKSTLTRFHYRESWPAFAQAMRALIGTDLPSAVAAEFGVPTQRVRDWRLGKAGLPLWVVEKAHQELSQRLGAALQQMARITPGPGKTGDIQKRYGGKRKSPATGQGSEALKR